ncbi:pectinesterase-like [Neltuma alba]|uniref:pectinesterase-like n=1 Tax=Neltuma alba TaxID=207710 RepID=UPI0010A39B08|nr:pectinesterase-like [Prosopis alba]
MVGDGFIVKGITIENPAGPSKHQAVALRNGADTSAFYQCIFVGYEDTLYVRSLRQLTFYRECDIYCNVDFIFGNNATSVLCNLYAGDGFIVEGITIENPAGPSKHQVVALRNGADTSAFL